MALNPRFLGPDISHAQTTNILNPTTTQNAIEKYQWSLDGEMWPTFVKGYGNGDVTRAKGILKLLASTLIFSLNNTSRQIVEKSIQKDELDMEINTQGEDQNNAEEQLKLANEIVKLVAKDSLTDDLRPLIKLS